MRAATASYTPQQLDHYRRLYNERVRGRDDYRKDVVRSAGKKSAETFQIDESTVNLVYRPHLHNNARTQIYFGGSSSGKSYFLAQRCIWDLLENGRNYLVVRQVKDTIKDSVFAELENAIAEMGVEHRFHVTRSPMQITSDVGTQVLFRGLDKVEKVKSIRPKKGAITDVWVEEATECRLKDIAQLRKRQRGGDVNIPKRLTLSFNPIYQTHEIFTTYFGDIGWADDETCHESDTLTILKTTYKDNEFLAPDDVYELESEKDSYMYEVYTLGNWGVLGDVIFTNWRIADLSDMRAQLTNPRTGLDFGYGADPAALVHMHYDKKRKRIYVFDELYLYGHTNPQLAERVKPIVGNGSVACDSAEPKSIQELRDEGVKAYGAKKGKNSIMFGVQFLQQHEIVVDSSCISFQNELRTYQWASDRQGNKLNRPIDKDNHGIDAARYALELDMAQEPKKSNKKPKRVTKLGVQRQKIGMHTIKGRY